MSDNSKIDDVFKQRLNLLDAAELQKTARAFTAKLDHRAAAYLNSCVHCGLCAETCHYYLSDGETESIPAYKLNLLASIFKHDVTVIGRMLPSWNGARPLDKAMLEELVDTLFGRCTLCARCTLNCSVGIDISGMIHLGRSVLAVIEMVPPELQSTVNTAVEHGNNMGIPRTEWVETIRWLEEELQQEVGNADARIPIDVPGARILYTVNPREPKFFPLSLLATAKIFYAARESWTLSSEYYDVTNYGFLSGSDDAAGLISDRLVKTMKNLDAKLLALGECGHGFNANRWEAPEWLGAEYGIEAKSIVQVVADYVRQGRIKLDSARQRKRVTLHDPCHLVRLGGVIEDQRYVLKRAVSTFVEMYPNRENNFCCGGGGGQLSMTRYAARRLKAGSVKADQIRKTGAEVVVAPCHNCIDQLLELNKEYKLGVQVKTLSEIVADALMMERPKASPTE